MCLRAGLSKAHSPTLIRTTECGDVSSSDKSRDGSSGPRSFTLMLGVSVETWEWEFGERVTMVGHIPSEAEDDELESDS